MIVNRVGDLSFAVGIALVFSTFGAIDFPTIFANVHNHLNDSYGLFGGQFRALEVMGYLLFIGAMGKSAQILLHTWLPDAMEGPTPVSALIHAATMVTAGVFLMARMSPILEFAPGALRFVTFIGATTCFFAATVACVQNDIKRVIAYSTCSQLGYMFIAAGVGAFQASIFHLITHAFFKALLFLCAGSVIHAMSDEQDMRRMGGIFRKVPVTAVCMWIGSLAIAGIPYFAGYWSKDAILESAYAAATPVSIYAFMLGTAAAFLTAFYSWRLLFMTFHGQTRADHHVMQHAHESPLTMLVPLGAAQRWRDLRRLVVPRSVHWRYPGRLLAGRDFHRSGQPCHRTDRAYAFSHRHIADSHGRSGNCARLLVLHARHILAGAPRGAVRSALSFPAQQMVFR